MFPTRETKHVYDFGMPTKEEWWVDEIARHDWTKDKVRFVVRWTSGDHTWETYETCKDLIALDDYFVLHRVDHWQQLPRVSKTAVVRDVPGVMSKHDVKVMGQVGPKVNSTMEVSVGNAAPTSTHTENQQECRQRCPPASKEYLSN